MVICPPIGLVGRVFANRLGDRDSFPSRVIPNTQIMLFDASLFNTQLYKVRISGQMERSREISSVLPYTSVLCNIMAEGFCFMPLGLVRLRTFRLSACVSWVQH